MDQRNCNAYYLVMQNTLNEFQKKAYDLTTQNYSKEDLQGKTLELVKSRIVDSKGYLHTLLERLEIKITKLKETQNPSVPEIGEVIFLAEFLNREIDGVYDSFDHDNEMTVLARTYMHEDPEFRKEWLALKKDRDDTYSMLFDYLKTQDKSVLSSKLKEYSDFLLRYTE